MLYTNITVTTNQKPAIDAHIKRERNPSITLKKLIRPQGKRAKRRKEKNREL